MGAGAGGGGRGRGGLGAGALVVGGTLVELAAVACLSPSYFLRQFKAATGLAPHLYLSQQRVEHARHLLLESSLNIAEIAHAVGFVDQSHLHRHLKRALGLPPSALLKERKNVQKERKNIQDEPCIV